MMLLLRTPLTTAATKWSPRRASWRTMRPLVVPMTTITHHSTPSSSSSSSATRTDSNAVGAVRQYHHHHTDIRFPNLSFGRTYPDFISSVLPPPPTPLSSLGFYHGDTTTTIITNHHISHPQYQQVRYKGRNDGNTQKHNTRKSTKKHQKVYHRKLQKQQLKTGRHSPPNSKANLRRGYAERERTEILNTPDDLLLQPPASKSKYDDTDALLDDLMGNVREVSPTPEPTYLGHLQSKYYTMVVDQMDDYFRNASSSQVAQLTESTTHPSSSSSSSTITTTPSHPADLPTDELISQAVRAYRDRHGSRNRNPIGLRAALQHVLYDLQVPLVALGEYTYTTLLTCCRSPTEGRRVLQMIQEQGLPISSYSYSILCHLHANAGDYQGCINVQQEMLQEQLSPTLVSYTSLLAACYKVSNNGRIPHPERAQAVQAGWKKWQEMRIIGIEPDVMAYGAILRLKASIGKAEECLSLLNEMVRFQIYPTTLCYTTALQAVARSHAIAIRYEKGISRRNRRREMITTHHGKLARQIVIMAEGANFVPDEGFMSALCLCAGAAGDIATVKAIAVAYEILATQHDHLRTIGSNDHLERLQGGIDPHRRNESSPYHFAGDNRGMLSMENQSSAFSMASSSSMGQEHKYDEPIIGAERRIHNDNHTEISLRNTEFTTPSTNGNGSPHQQHRGKSYIPPFAEREYGRDNRLLSSIIHACAQAVDPNMMGTIWQGRENKGYLCINSLRLIQQIKIPQYTDNSIPEQTITDNLKIVQEDRDDGYREGKRRSRKFQGVDIDENVASTMEEMLGDKDLTRRYLNPDGRRKAEYRNATPDEIWKLKYGEDWEKKYANDDKSLAYTARMKSISASSTVDNNSVERSEDDMIKSYLESFDDSEDLNEVGDDSVGEKNQNESKSKQAENTAGDIYFDYETMRWKPISEQKKVPVTTSSHISAKENPKEKVENVVVREEPSSASTEEEMYFDTDVMRWKTRPKIQPTEPKSRTLKTTMTQVVRETPQDRYEPKLKSNEERSDQDDESDLSDDDDDDDGWESASDDSDEDEDYVFDKKKQEWVVKSQASKQDASASIEEIEEMSQGMNDSGEDENFELEFHYDKSEYDQKLVTKISDSSSDASNVVERNVSELERNEHVEAALYYDEKTQEWKMKNSDGIGTKLEEQEKYSDEKSASTNIPASIADATSNESVIDKAAENEKAFAIFYADLRRESLENEQEDVTEEEARELFDIMKDEYNEMIVMTPEELGLEDHPVVVEQRTKVLPEDEPSASGAVEEQDAPLSQSFNEEKNTQILQSARSNPFEKSSSASQNDISVNVAATRSLESSSSFTPQQADTTVEKFWGDSNFGTSTQTVLLDPSHENHSYSQNVDEIERTTEMAQVNTGEDASQISSPSSSNASGVGGSSLLQFFEMFSTENDDVVEDYRLERLRELLPHFSERRLIKIVQCYQRSLEDPSILELIPIVRENMPDYITSTWLKQMATMTAKFAIQKAAQNDLINPQILNSVLELHTSSGSLDRAIEFHHTEFAAHNLEPTEYSDRLVIQMLLRNNRFNRALDFKQTVQSSGRSLDIKAYGSLVEFCARRKQLGSALLLLKECLSTHGAAPGEASLSNLRILCRQAGIVDEIGLERMIGTDPIEWLRQGEREKKREYSKKGRRNVQLARNVMLRV